MSDTIEMKCGKCGADTRIHKPILTRLDDGLVSMVMLVPSWSLDERKCKACGCVVTPRIAQKLQIDFICVPPAEKAEAPRIVLPGPLPIDIERRLKMG